MIQHFFKHSFTYAVPNFIAAGLNILFLPIYTRLLLPEEYGVVEMVILASTLLNILFSLEISQGYARLVPDAKDLEEKIIYSSTSFWFVAIIFGFLLLVTFIIPGLVSKIILGHRYPTHLIIIAAFIITINALYYHVINQLRWNRQSRSWAMTRLLYVISYNSFAVLLLYLGYGLKGFLIGELLGFVIAFANGVYACRKTVPIKFAFHTEKLKEMLIYSTPLVFSSIACYISLYTDRWMLSYYLGMNDVGIYSVAYKVASIITLLIIGFQQAFVPLVYHNYKKPETPVMMADIFRYFLLLLLPLIAILSLLAGNLLNMLVGEEFQAGAALIPWLTLSIFFLNVYFFAPGMGLAKKTKKVALTNIFAAATNVLLNFMLIPVYGGIGAVLGTLGGGIVMTFLYFFWSSKEYYVPYPWYRIVFLLSGILMIFLLNSKWILPLSYKILICLIFSAYVLALLLKKSDLNKIVTFLNHYRFI